MISQNLMKLRKLYRYSLEEVANQIQVSRQAVSKWESGETLPDLDNCIALSKLFNVTLDDLVNYNENEYQLPIPPKGKYCFGVVTVGERGQIVIPKKARTVFNISAGDELIMLGDEEQGIALTKVDLFMQVASELMNGDKLK